MGQGSCTCKHVISKFSNWCETGPIKIPIVYLASGNKQNSAGQPGSSTPPTVRAHFPKVFLFISSISRYLCFVKGCILCLRALLLGGRFLPPRGRGDEGSASSSRHEFLVFLAFLRVVSQNFCLYLTEYRHLPFALLNPPFLFAAFSLLHSVSPCFSILT